MQTIYTILFIYVFYKLVRIYLEYIKYKNSQYYKQTKFGFLDVYFNEAKVGEYCVEKYLKKLLGYKKFLFNTYITRKNGTTTEIDVILIHDSGIYVFESKNYSGFIYGTEDHQYWTQVLPSGGKSKKYKFFNPIIQNKVHIKELSKYLNDENIPLYSYITFSDRCTLKKINLTSDDHKVINRYNVLKALNIRSNDVGTILSIDKINAIYEKLYPLTQVADSIKLMHIDNIKNKKDKI